MALAALFLTLAWLVIVGGVRGYLHYRRTGQMAVKFRDRRGSWQWWARLVSAVGVLLALAAPIAELAGLAPISVLDRLPLRIAGTGLVIVGIVAALGSQFAMGDSWRGDVDPDARTTLVTKGPFRFVRNPILTSTAVSALGLALMVPNPVAALMLAAFVAGMQIQIRKVEEPYLLGIHGDDYRQYAAQTGRFLPGIGRLRAHGSGAAREA
jgi:protein-S-isoprenylcysteine O-methyltransferase Ste14